MFGAEQVLMDRATSAERRRERDRHGQRLQRLLPPVQPADLREPVAGQQGGRPHDARGEVARRVQKGGDAPVAQVLRYGEPAPVGLGGSPHQRARQRRRVVDGDGGGGRAHPAVHDGPRHAARLPVADDQDRTNTRPRARRSRTGSTSTRADRARHQHVRGAAGRSCSRWCSTSRAGARRRTTSATATARSRSGRTASRCERCAGGGAVAEARRRAARVGTNVSAGAGGAAAATRRCPRRCCSSARATSCARSSTGCSRG